MHFCKNNTSIYLLFINVLCQKKRLSLFIILNKQVYNIIIYKNISQDVNYPSQLFVCTYIQFCKPRGPKESCRNACLGMFNGLLCTIVTNCTKTNVILRNFNHEQCQARLYFLPSPIFIYVCAFSVNREEGSKGNISICTLEVHI